MVTTIKTKTQGRTKSAAGSRVHAPTARTRTTKTVRSVPKSVNAVRSTAASKKKDIAFFIDLDNTNANATNVLEIISILRTYGNVVYGKLYGYTDAAANEFAEVVQEYRLETAGKLRFKTDGVSIIDTRLLFDAAAMAEKNKFAFVFVWTGVGELIPLFSKLKDCGCTTMTVDMPEFDSQNKFIDQKIRLYSDYRFAPGRMSAYVPPKVTPYAAPVPTFSKSTETEIKPTVKADKTTQIIDELIADAPILPRMKDAPELGSTEPIKLQNDVDDEGMSEDEAREFYRKLAGNVFSKVSKSVQEEKIGEELSELVTVEDKSDDMSLTPDLPEPAFDAKLSPDKVPDTGDMSFEPDQVPDTNDMSFEPDSIPEPDKTIEPNVKNEPEKAPDTSFDPTPVTWEDENNLAAEANAAIEEGYDGQDFQEQPKPEKMKYDMGGYDFGDSPVVDDRIYEKTPEANAFTEVDSDFGNLSAVPTGDGVS